MTLADVDLCFFKTFVNNFLNETLIKGTSLKIKIL